MAGRRVEFCGSFAWGTKGSIVHSAVTSQHGFVSVSVGRPAEDYLSPVRVGLKVARF